MAPGTWLQSDFTAGELSPSLLARVDFAKYTKGCRTMRNFMVQSHGGAIKRSGFTWLGTLPSPAKLAEFVFNTEQTYCLVFGEKWLRIATHEGFILDDNGNTYEIESPYTLEQAKNFSYTQSADVLFIACQEVKPYKLMRLGHTNWKFEAMNFDAPLDPPQWEKKEGINYTYALYLPSGSSYRYITETVIRNGQREYVSKLVANTIDVYKQTATPYSYAYITFVNGAKKSDGSKSAAQLVTPYTYYVTAINAQGKESGASEKAEIKGPSSNNWQAGDYIELTWSKVEGAEEYRLYKSEYDGRAGYITSTKGNSFQDHNIAPSISEGIPKYINPFILKDAEGKEVEDYPGAVCLFEQRLVFASTPKRPQTIWMSKSGDYTNFATYTPVTDDSSVELTIASQEVSPANWLIPLRSLILGTPSMEWEISGQSDSAFSGKNAKATPQSYWGSTLKRALIVGNIILHVSSSGRQVRNLQYDFGSDSYAGSDLSIVAAHLLEKEKLTDWAFQKSPDSIIWGIRSDGVLLGLTFQAEHQIAAWHRHDTDGKFVAVCSVPHGMEHSLFTVVLRDGVYSLERMAEKYQHGGKAIFLDASLTLQSDKEVTKVSGLEHLEGKTVGIYADNAVVTPRKVTNGTIQLDTPANTVTVGLCYTSELETMPVEVAGETGVSVGLKKQISTVNITFQDSYGVSVGLSSSEKSLENITWQDIQWRSNEPYGSPPQPFSGIKHMTMSSLADNILCVCIKSEMPTPVAVQSIMTRIEVKG